MRSFRHLRIWLTTFQSSIWCTWVNKQKNLGICVSGILPLPWTYHEILYLMGTHRPKHLSYYAKAWGTYGYSCTTAAHLLTSSHEDLSGWLLTAFKPWVLLSMKVWGRAAAQACAPLSVCRTYVAVVGLKSTQQWTVSNRSWLLTFLLNTFLLGWRCGLEEEARLVSTGPPSILKEGLWCQVQNKK